MSYVHCSTIAFTYIVLSHSAHIEPGAFSNCSCIQTFSCTQTDGTSVFGINTFLIRYIETNTIFSKIAAYKKIAKYKLSEKI